MTTRGMPFSGESVLALLTCAQCGVLSPGVCPECGSAEKRKSVTRRVARLQPEPHGKIYRWRPRPGVVTYGTLDGFAATMSPHQPGDIVWAREAWRTERKYDDWPPRDLPDDAAIEYLADHSCNTISHVSMRRVERLVAGRTRSSRFLPQRFARIRREVEVVRAERLQDITEEDAEAEGAYNMWAHWCDTDNWPPAWVGPKGITDDLDHGRDARGIFQLYWDQLHEKRHNGAFVWAEDPVVFAYRLKVSSNDHTDREEKR